MRVARVLGAGESFYHILSRIVDRRLILNDSERSLSATGEELIRSE